MDTHSKDRACHTIVSCPRMSMASVEIKMDHRRKFEYFAERMLVCIFAILLLPLAQLVRAEDKFEVEATGATSGFARGLFRLDVYHRATESKATLTPIHFYQEEKYRSEIIKTNVDFKPDQVTGLREKIPSDHPPKPNIFKFNSVFDMTTALLWVRSQPLADGETESLVVWASNAPYLATVKVVGRETIKINGQKRKAIKLDLKLKGIDKKLRLKEHSLFKSGRGWLSDDENRVPLRIEADIFIGYVFAQLESLSVE